MDNQEKRELYGIERWAKTVFAGASVILISFITVLITVDTMLRYFAGAPLEGGMDISGLALFLLFCACFPYSWTGGFHVRMDLFYNRFPRQIRRAIDTLGICCAFAFGAFLAFRSVISVSHAYRMQSTMPMALYLPLWPFMLAGCVAFIGFCLVMIINLAGTWSNRERMK